MKLMTLAQVEYKYLARAVRRWKRGMIPLSKELGISRATLYRKLIEYNIDTPHMRRMKEEHDEGFTVL